MSYEKTGGYASSNKPTKLPVVPSGPAPGARTCDGNGLCLKGFPAEIDRLRAELDKKHPCGIRASGRPNCEYRGCCIDGTCCSCCSVAERAEARLAAVIALCDRPPHDYLEVCRVRAAATGDNQ